MRSTPLLCICLVSLKYSLCAHVVVLASVFYCLQLVRECGTIQTLVKTTPCARNAYMHEQLYLFIVVETMFNVPICSV